MAQANATFDDHVFKCGICTDDLIDETQHPLVICKQCCNTFHQECADEWNFSRHSKIDERCPVCNTHGYDMISKKSYSGFRTDGEEPWYVKLPTETFIPSTMKYIKNYNNSGKDLTLENAITMAQIYTDVCGKVKHIEKTNVFMIVLLFGGPFCMAFSVVISVFSSAFVLQRKHQEQKFPPFHE